MREEQNNPYQAPNASLDTPIVKQPGSIAKAVILGLVTDIAFTNLIAFLVIIPYVIIMASKGDDIEALLGTFEQMDLNNPLWIGLAVTGALCSILGGYLCARIAYRNNYKAIHIIAAVGISLYIPFALFEIAFAESITKAVLEQIAMIIVTCIAYYIGGWIVIRKLKHPQTKA